MIDGGIRRFFLKRSFYWYIHRINVRWRNFVCVLFLSIQWRLLQNLVIFFKDGFKLRLSSLSRNDTLLLLC